MMETQSTQSKYKFPPLIGCILIVGGLMFVTAGLIIAVVAWGIYDGVSKARELQREIHQQEMEELRIQEERLEKQMEETDRRIRESAAQTPQAAPPADPLEDLDIQRSVTRRVIAESRGEEAAEENDRRLRSRDALRRVATDRMTIDGVELEKANGQWYFTGTNVRAEVTWDGEEHVLGVTVRTNKHGVEFEYDPHTREWQSYHFN